MVRRFAVAMAVGCAVVALAGAAPADVPVQSGDLRVVQQDPDPAPVGGTTTVHAIVANDGPTDTTPFVVTVSLPDGVSAPAPGRLFFPNNCAVLPDGRSVQCTFPRGLRSGQTATALVPVQIAANPPADVNGNLTGGQVAVSNADDPNPDNNTAPFTIHVTG